MACLTLVSSGTGVTGMAGALTGAFPALTEGEVEGEESSLANSCTNACAATSTLDDSPCQSDVTFNYR